MDIENYRKIIVEKLITEETRKMNEKIGHLNHLDSICLNRELTSEEFIEVYERIWRNLMKICDNHLKNSFSRKERYENEIKKAFKPISCVDFDHRTRQDKWLERIENKPVILGFKSTDESDPNSL